MTITGGNIQRILTAIAGIGLLLCPPAVAEITEGGAGMLFGRNHAFFVAAAPGWVLDNRSAVNQGLFMVFYLAGKTWGNSPVVVYGQSCSKPEIPSIEAQVKKTVTDFRKNGSSDYTAEKRPSLVRPDGKEAAIYHYSGDQWGNFEAVAYYDEAETINFLVFNARSKALFDEYLPDFFKMTASYDNHYTPPVIQTQVAADAWIAEAKRQLDIPGGKDYEGLAINFVGQRMANAIAGCTGYLSGQKQRDFNIFFRINGNGSIAQSELYPAHSLGVCFKGMTSHISFPPHTFNSFLLHIDMRVTDGAGLNEAAVAASAP